MLLTKLLLVVLCGTLTQGAFTEEEMEVVVSGLQALKITRCVLVSETITKAAVKKLHRSFILSTFVGRRALGVYLRGSRQPDATTAIVMKTPPTEALIENHRRMVWFTWFLVAEELDERLRVPFNCQFFLVRKECNGTYRFLEKYHIKKSPTFSNEFAAWTPGRGLNSTTLSFYGRRKDMKGVELVRTDSEIYECSRFKMEHELRELWVESSRLLNFSLRVVNVHLNTSSQRNRPDGSTCIWGITNLDKNNDWVFINFDIPVRLVTKFRSSNEIGWRAYAKPFKSEMWAALGLWLLISTVAIVVVNGCTQEILYRDVLTAFYCLCNSDPTTTHPPNEPTSFSTKLVYLMTLTVPAVMVPAYSAYILSMLSIVSPLEPFHDMKSLIADGTFKVSAAHNTFVIRYFQGSQDPEIKQINDHLFVGADNVAQDFIQLFDQICNDPHLAGLFVDNKDFRSLFPCKMFVIKQEIISINMGFLLQKDSPMKKLFNELFAMYHEKGILHRPPKVREDVLSEVALEEVQSQSSLNMSQMSAIFLIIPLGILLSGVILGLEIALARKFQVLKGF